MTKIKRTTTRDIQGSISRVQYNIFADVLFNLKETTSMIDAQHEMLCARAADELSKTNKNFKWTRFYNRARGHGRIDGI